jgi:glc operon protein GlcG
MRRERLVSLAVGAMLILGVSFASAQQPAPATPPPPPPPYGAPITLEQAKKVLAGAEAEAKKNSWNMVIVVMDSGGNLVALERMDGAQLGSIEVARDKAYSAVAFRRPTKAFDDALAQGGANLRILKLAGASPIEGGIPIVVDGKVIGSVGASVARRPRTPRSRGPESTI